MKLLYDVILLTWQVESLYFPRRRGRLDTMFSTRQNWLCSTDSWTHTS